MYTRWLYTHQSVPLKNLEIRRYKCGHYYLREFITSPSGAYVLKVKSLRRTTKKKLVDILECYFLYASDVINTNKR